MNKVRSDFAAIAIFRTPRFHQVFVELHQLFDQALARVQGRFSVLIRQDVGSAIAQTSYCLPAPIEDSASDKIHDAALIRERRLDEHCVAAQRAPHRSNREVKIGADAIELVYKRNYWKFAALGLPPDRLGLRLHAGDRVDEHQRAVHDAQRALDLDREIDVPRRIDQRDLVIAIRERDRGRLDGDAALPLLWQKVRHRVAVVDVSRRCNKA
mmetsp:Transcript_11049/g.29681  ORF Transcript_11049/g.29681 Transcript_11049/m.29681 type:complete len:212 (+) Transcript_11049:2077-2712(+)